MREVEFMTWHAFDHFSEAHAAHDDRYLIDEDEDAGTVWQALNSACIQPAVSAATGSASRALSLSLVEFSIGIDVAATSPAIAANCIFPRHCHSRRCPVVLARRRRRCRGRSRVFKLQAEV